MNYLAHQFLSFQNTDIQLGNLYGEIVRGKDYENYSGDIRKGILLHRSIDTFTDSHEIVKESSKKFHEKYGKFSPIIVDVVYDYFLIKNWNTYSNIEFETFVDDCYSLLNKELENFPEKLNFIVRHLLKYDWFHNYQSLSGIEDTLRGIRNRSKFENQIDQSIVEIQANYEELNQEFQAFFPELMQHCQDFIAKPLN
jgi:acyl carrier protein phosphodiesterase